MAKVNITQAAKLAGVARTTLYNTYIKAGKITVTKVISKVTPFFFCISVFT